MKLKGLSLSFSLLLLAQIVPAFGNEIKTFPCGENATYSVSLPQGVLSDGNKCSGNITLDSSVKFIDDFAFGQYRCKDICAKFDGDLTSISIPDSVTSIGKNAFEGTHITSIVIPNSITSIGEKAFAGSRLNSIILSNSLKSINNEVFLGTPLKAIDIPNSVTSIGSFAFGGTSLENVFIPDSVIGIGDFAFENTPLKTLSIGKSVERIGHGAFAGTKLNEIKIPDSVVAISTFAFKDSPLTSVILGWSLRSIGRGAFSGTSLETLVMPPFVTSLECGVFSGITTLSSVSLPASVTRMTSVGNGCESPFERNFALTKIEYCGTNKLEFLPIAPTCSPERKALDQAIINEAKAKIQVNTKQNAEAKVKAKVLIQKTTITCIKGKLTRKVTAINPKCPAGYKKKS